eukprot:ANDGO_02408.mRNA.1 Patronin (microtubule-binding protein) homolog
MYSPLTGTARRFRGASEYQAHRSRLYSSFRWLLSAVLEAHQSGTTSEGFQSRVSPFVPDMRLCWTVVSAEDDRSLDQVRIILASGMLYLFGCEVLFQECPTTIAAYMASPKRNAKTTMVVVTKWMETKLLDTLCDPAVLCKQVPFDESAHQAVIDTLMSYHLSSISITEVAHHIQESGMEEVAPYDLQDALSLWLRVDDLHDLSAVQPLAELLRLYFPSLIPQSLVTRSLPDRVAALDTVFEAIREVCHLPVFVSTEDVIHAAPELSLNITMFIAELFLRLKDRRTVRKLDSRSSPHVSFEDDDQTSIRLRREERRSASKEEKLKLQKERLTELERKWKDLEARRSRILTSPTQSSPQWSDSPSRRSSNGGSPSSALQIPSDDSQLPASPASAEARHSPSGKARSPARMVDYDSELEILRSNELLSQSPSRYSRRTSGESASSAHQSPTVLEAQHSVEHLPRGESPARQHNDVAEHGDYEGESRRRPHSAHVSKSAHHGASRSHSESSHHKNVSYSSADPLPRSRPVRSTKDRESMSSTGQGATLAVKACSSPSSSSSSRSAAARDSSETRISKPQASSGHDLHSPEDGRADNSSPVPVRTAARASAGSQHGDDRASDSRQYPSQPATTVLSRDRSPSSLRKTANESENVESRRHAGARRSYERSEDVSSSQNTRPRTAPSVAASSLKDDDRPQRAREASPERLESPKPVPSSPIHASSPDRTSSVNHARRSGNNSARSADPPLAPESTRGSTVSSTSDDVLLLASPLQSPAAEKTSGVSNSARDLDRPSLLVGDAYSDNEPMISSFPDEYDHPKSDLQDAVSDNSYEEDDERSNVPRELDYGDEELHARYSRSSALRSSSEPFAVESNVSTPDRSHNFSDARSPSSSSRLSRSPLLHSNSDDDVLRSSFSSRLDDSVSAVARSVSVPPKRIRFEDSVSFERRSRPSTSQSQAFPAHGLSSQGGEESVRRSDSRVRYADDRQDKSVRSSGVVAVPPESEYSHEDDDDDDDDDDRDAHRHRNGDAHQDPSHALHSPLGIEVDEDRGNGSSSGDWNTSDASVSRSEDFVMSPLRQHPRRRWERKDPVLPSPSEPENDHRGGGTGVNADSRTGHEQKFADEDKRLRFMLHSQMAQLEEERRRQREALERDFEERKKAAVLSFLKERKTGSPSASPQDSPAATTENTIASSFATAEPHASEDEGPQYSDWETAYVREENEQLEAQFQAEQQQADENLLRSHLVVSEAESHDPEIPSPERKPISITIPVSEAAATVSDRSYQAKMEAMQRESERRRQRMIEERLKKDKIILEREKEKEKEREQRRSPKSGPPPQPSSSAATSQHDHQSASGHPALAAGTPPPPRWAAAQTIKSPTPQLKRIAVGASSNKKLIRNAIRHVCLAGFVNQQACAQVTEVLDAHVGEYFYVAIRDADHPTYRGLYYIDEVLQKAVLIHTAAGAVLPSEVTSDNVESFLKYDSGSKRFRTVMSKEMGVNVDACVVKFKTRVVPR